MFTQRLKSDTDACQDFGLELSVTEWRPVKALDFSGNCKPQFGNSYSTSGQKSDREKPDSAYPPHLEKVLRNFISDIKNCSKEGEEKKFFFEIRNERMMKVQKWEGHKKAQRLMKPAPPKNRIDAEKSTIYFYCRLWKAL